MKLMLSVREAAKLLQTTEEDVYRRIRQGQIPARRVHDRYVLHRAELLEWATSQGIRLASDAFRAPLQNGSAQPEFAESLERGGIHHGVGGADREGVLRAIVERMPIDAADRDEIADFLLAREALGSTGVGDGIAIPHVRNPVVLHVAHPSVTLCFLEKPVDFEAIDGKPVHTVFTLVSRTIRSHLYLLSRISAALHDAEFRRCVVERASAETILEATRRVEATFARSGRKPT